MLKPKYSYLILLLSIILTSSFMLTACWGDLDSSDISEKNSTETTDSEENTDGFTEEEMESLITKDYDNGIVFEEESEDYEIQVSKEPASEFIGKWEATSGNAHYLLGNLDLNIKSTGKWKGSVAGEKLSGTWSEKDAGIYLKCNDPKVNFGGQLVFTPEGTLLYSYYPLENSTEPNTIVLTKK